MDTNEPESLPQVISEERKTMELCGDEHGGKRCMLPKGHPGHHECHAVNHYLSWK